MWLPVCPSLCLTGLVRFPCALVWFVFPPCAFGLLHIPRCCLFLVFVSPSFFFCRFFYHFPAFGVSGLFYRFVRCDTCPQPLCFILSLVCAFPSLFGASGCWSPFFCVEMLSRFCGLPSSHRFAHDFLLLFLGGFLVLVCCWSPCLVPPSPAVFLFLVVVHLLWACARSSAFCCSPLGSLFPSFRACLLCSLPGRLFFALSRPLYPRFLFLCLGLFVPPSPGPVPPLHSPVVAWFVFPCGGFALFLG